MVQLPDGTYPGQLMVYVSIEPSYRSRYSGLINHTARIALFKEVISVYQCGPLLP